MEVRSNPHPNKFILFCNPRTGSSLFGSLLSTHPKIYWAKERFKAGFWKGYKKWLWPIARYFPALFLEIFAARHNPLIYGCKLLPYQVVDVGSALRQLHARGWLILYLRRQNMFQLTLSYLVSTEQKHWRTYQDSARPSTKQLTINPAIFLAELERQTHFLNLQNTIARTFPHLDFVYENDLVDAARWPETAGKVFDALGLERLIPTTSIVKTWEKPYPEFVLNYCELVQAVRSSPLAQYASAED